MGQASTEPGSLRDESRRRRTPLAAYAARRLPAHRRVGGLVPTERIRPVTWHLLGR